jgi:hypothetical protein
MEANMSSVFREGHNKPKPRVREPLRIQEDPKPLSRVALWLPLAAVLVVIAFFLASNVSAHPRSGQHAHILHSPLAGVRNNYWYDYRSDVEEAESELRKDLRRAKSSQDRREAWAEYNQELRDARQDYTREMVEKGYIRRPRGEVIVGGY